MQIFSIFIPFSGNISSQFHKTNESHRDPSLIQWTCHVYTCTKYPLFIPLVCDEKKDKSIHKALSTHYAFQLATALISPHWREKLKNRKKVRKKSHTQETPDTVFHLCLPDWGFLCHSSLDNPAPLWVINFWFLGYVVSCACALN